MKNVRVTLKGLVVCLTAPVWASVLAIVYLIGFLRDAGGGNAK